MEPVRPDVVEQNIYVPYSEEVLASVWAVDTGLQMFSNVSEDLAKENAEEFTDKIIYFFAELTPESVDGLLDRISELQIELSYHTGDYKGVPIK